MVEHRFGDRVVRLIRGDLTALDVEAIVFDIDSEMKLGAGFGSAIQRRGPSARPRRRSRDDVMGARPR